MRAEQDEYTWPTIGVQFRSKVSKMLKMTPNEKSDTMAYLKTLVLKMMDADSKRDRTVNAADSAISGLLRTVPVVRDNLLIMLLITIIGNDNGEMADY